MSGGSATFSHCGTYRYDLWRKWDTAKAACVFIGLNPSTATAVTNDPTIRRCIDFARRWGFGGMCMLNLFAYRTPHPKHLLKAPVDPIGPENNDSILTICESAPMVIAAWGRDGSHLERDRQVLALLDPIVRVHCLKHNGDGSPAHPLYLRKTLNPIPLR